MTTPTQIGGGIGCVIAGWRAYHQCRSARMSDFEVLQAILKSLGRKRKKQDDLAVSAVGMSRSRPPLVVRA